MLVCLLSVVTGVRSDSIGPGTAQQLDQSQSGLTPDWTNVTQNFFTLSPGTTEPVLTKNDVTDRAADFVADPFLFHENGIWYMFFEVATQNGEKCEIGLATSEDGLTWTYQQVVLTASNHFAYPYVFEWDGNYYMIPDTFDLGEVRLYQATNFPYGWTYVSTLISGNYGCGSFRLTHRFQI